MIDNENTQEETVETLTELQQTLEGAPEAQVTAPQQPIANQAIIKPQDSFRQVREKLEKAERERDEYARRLAEQSAPKPQVQVPDEDLNFNIGENDIAEGKHLSKVGRKMKQLEEKIAQVEQRRVDLERQTESNSIIAGIKADFPDIDKVVNESTMEALKQRYPHLERTIRSSPDLYSKAAAAYQTIKDLGIYVEDTYVSEREKVQRNIAKPKPTAAVSGTGTPLSQAEMFAGGLTPELKLKLHQEMIEAMKAR